MSALLWVYCWIWVFLLFILFLFSGWISLWFELLSSVRVCRIFFISIDEVDVASVEWIYRFSNRKSAYFFRTTSMDTDYDQSQQNTDGSIQSRARTRLEISRVNEQSANPFQQGCDIELVSFFCAFLFLFFLFFSKVPWVLTTGTLDYCTAFGYVPVRYLRIKYICYPPTMWENRNTANELR